MWHKTAPFWTRWPNKQLQTYSWHITHQRRQQAQEERGEKVEVASLFWSIQPLTFAPGHHSVNSINVIFECYCWLETVVCINSVYIKRENLSDNLSQLVFQKAPPSQSETIGNPYCEKSATFCLQLHTTGDEDYERKTIWRREGGGLVRKCKKWQAPLSADAWSTCRLSYTLIFLSDTRSFGEIPDRKYSWLDKRSPLMVETAVEEQYLLGWQCLTSNQWRISMNCWLQTSSLVFPFIKSVTITTVTVFHRQKLSFHSLGLNCHNNFFGGHFWGVEQWTTKVSHIEGRECWWQFHVL